MKMCLLIDWADEDGNVAEGCILSSEPDDIVNDTRLGPTDFIVLVESANEPEVYLWRPARNMCTIKEVVGHIIAWPKNKCVELGQGLQPKDIAPLVNFFSDVLPLRPLIGRSSERGFRDEDIALDHFKRFTGGIRLAFVVSGGNPDFASEFNPHLA